jgi:hypothetical protein
MAMRNRKRFFVDFKVQGSLLLRSAMYWAFCLLTISFMLIIWRVVTGPPELFSKHLVEVWQRFAPALVASCLLLPLVMMDSVRLSNRFAGPIFRLRRAMKALVRGENVQALHFRDGDFWHDLADDFNVVATRLQLIPSKTQPAMAEEESGEQRPVHTTPT